MPDLDLNFSSAYHIENDKLSLRDPAKDFYYDLTPPPGTVDGLATLPIHIEKGTQSQVWLDKHVPIGYSRADARFLGMQITSTVTEHVKDKVFFERGAC